MPLFEDAVNAVRDRLVSGATSPFGHADYPLEHTLSHSPDPGLFGPDSASWAVIGDVSAFVGGIRALLVQAAHPEVVAGVADHSRYRVDPLGRLSRTSSYVTATTFGSIPEVEAAVATVRTAHRPVTGRSHRGKPYSAGKPDLAAWVHNALTDSFLVAFQHYGPANRPDGYADRFVAEQTEVGVLLDADPLPRTADALARWVSTHPDLMPSPGQKETVRFLMDPPLDPLQKLGYRFLFGAAVATLPRRIRHILGVRPPLGAAATGRRAVDLLRWGLGSSPSWHLALVRAGAHVPDDMFRQPLPVQRAGAIGFAATGE